ncbi:hypothetical protein FSP39_015819 [Pinctada imbricata]|uniref:Uncharacterized protein n=1 Tax=Pinctada imbricata TaxID=66713 RepID=A0AA88Y811_PINIB|nr:hypothetical protein FSP39_015819 [Pinctada imbricata]
MVYWHFKTAFLSYVAISLVIFIVLNVLIGSRDHGNRNFENIIRPLGKDGILKSPDTLFMDIEYYNVSELGDFEIPNTVHYVWCYDHTIKYEQYLSIISVWKLMRPDIIEFHCRYNISEDDPYDMWLKEIKMKISGFVVKRIPENWKFQQYRDCGIYYGIAVLHDRGGIYASDNVTFTKSVRSYRRKNFTVGLDSRGDVSFVMSSRRNFYLLHLAEMNSKHNQPFGSFKSAIRCSVISSKKLQVYKKKIHALC